MDLKMINMFRRKVKKLDPITLEVMDKIKEQAEILLQLIGDIEKLQNPEDEKYAKTCMDISVIRLSECVMWAVKAASIYE